MPLFKLFSKQICPFCSEQFYLGDCEVVSAVTNQVLRLPRTDFFSRLRPVSLNTAYYTKEMACRRCPCCQMLLPYNLERADNLTLAIIGDSCSGVSMYIAALIQQLKEGRIQQIGEYVRFSAVESDTDIRYRKDYYEILFEKRVTLSATSRSTSPIHGPLMYELVIRQSQSQREKRVNILFYDSAGEDIVQLETLVIYCRYVLHASAIIFLADPLTMPGIVAQLPSHLRPYAPRALKPSDILNRTVQIFERDIQNRKRLLSIPVAIALSKSDLLQYLQKPEQTYTLLHEPAPSQYLDLKDLQTVEREVKGILAQCGDQALLHAAKAISHVGFFAVAATGHPQDEQCHYPAVEPIRCLDPLLWILWKLKYIDAK